ncbi:MAG: tRNA (guanine(10)-N(2))-dimethyltransferase, partial [Nanoarchaeota archaeon]|nr:tRNA (guanine(10)-N(2))-dimethyltransferase [Nanoarchaeota archaeon]
MSLLTEHSAVLDLPLSKRAVHKKMDIFYNPVMASQRNLTILFLNVFPKRNMVVADPLAGTGIRTLRFLKELKRGKIKKILVNDLKENFLKTFENNLRKNKLQTAPVHASSQDANIFLLEQERLDYVDLDPFGSPNPFISAALARLSRGGILAVTATDTAALTGTYPSVTKRKYWATSQRNSLMHETGLRILIRKIQLHGTQFDRALIPKLAYSKEHYFRIFFQVVKGKQQADAIL